MEAMTRSWTDERLEERFDRIDTRFDRIDARFDALHRTLLQLGGVTIAALLGLLATQL
jgi:hypothetical protein